MGQVRERQRLEPHLARPGQLGVLPPRGRPGTWHITCVRYTRGQDVDRLMAQVAELPVDTPWRIARIAHLELRGDRYEPLAEWTLPPGGD